ncbi:MAG: hypothetical protein ACI9UK_000919 [Candidatus Krumholzibacteriia bacterium]|jgi:hypothetical protein
MTQRRLSLAILLVVIACAIGLGGLSQVRPVDGDEGYYATAARLIAEGKTPYKDFFYPQMPYFPYIYAPVYKMVGASIANMRWLSVALSVLGLAFWGSFLRSRFGDRPFVALAGLLIVALDPNLMSWNVTVKTYAFTNMAVFATIWALDRGLRTQRILWFGLAGVVAGLAVSVRLMYLPWAAATFLAFVWQSNRNDAVRISPKAPAAAAIGFLLALVPVLGFVSADLDRFWFNNYIYHHLRFSALDSVPDPAGLHWPQIEAALNVFARAIFNNFYLLLVVVIAFVEWVVSRRREASPVSALTRAFGVGAAAHIIVCLLPDPTHVQYFTSSLTPMLALLLVGGMESFGKIATVRNRLAPAFAGVLILCLGLATYELQVGKTGMNWNEVWSFEHQTAVKESIVEHTEPGDVVLAFWSGYVFESEREYVFGMQNHFAIGVSERLSLVEMVDYKIAGKEVILKAILTKEPKVVVLGAWMHEMDTTLEQQDLPLILQELESNYEIVWMLGETKVMVRRPGPGLKM